VQQLIKDEGDRGIGGSEMEIREITPWIKKEVNISCF
jgi:hypothetical protein